MLRRVLIITAVFLFLYLGICAGFGWYYYHKANGSPGKFFIVHDNIDFKMKYESYQSKLGYGSSDLFKSLLNEVRNRSYTYAYIPKQVIREKDQLRKTILHGFWKLPPRRMLCAFTISLIEDQ